jgi:hypothetical protein
MSDIGTETETDATKSDPVADLAAALDADKDTFVWAAKCLVPQINQLMNLRVQRAVGETEYKLRQRIVELEKELRELKSAIRKMAATT